ncbi:fascin [Acrasis kona]|uniref:Fascin n=1 Tax=Acrasis kona TaxID=1008807 RepID=A0AAW2ZGH2_9EUKA
MNNQIANLNDAQLRVQAIIQQYGVITHQQLTPIIQSLENINDRSLIMNQVLMHQCERQITLENRVRMLEEMNTQPAKNSITFGSKVALKTCTGHYVTDDKGRVFINRSVLNAWEIFTIVSADGKPFGSPVCVNDAVSFLSHRNCYLCCERDGEMVCNRRNRDTWETFHIVDQTNNNRGHISSTTPVAIRSHLYKFLNPSGYCSSQAIGEREKLYLISAQQ